jgi:ABC-type sugar transport system substrate-binding protein
LKDKLTTGGWNLTDVHLEGIKNGLLSITVGQRPYLQGYFPVVLAHLRRTAGYDPIDIDTGAEIVDASNIAAISQREAKWQGLTKAK